MRAPTTWASALAVAGLALVVTATPAAAGTAAATGCPHQYTEAKAKSFKPPLPAFVDGNGDGKVCVMETNFGANIIDNRVPSGG